MVRVYYHIYAVEGVESIIDEQVSLIDTYFDFPYIMNIGITTTKENQRISQIIDKLYSYNPNYRIRDVRIGGNEFTTLDLIELDKDIIADDDKILYLHTKGASKLEEVNYSNIVDWRNLLMYFNVVHVKTIFAAFKTNYNTFGCLLKRIAGFDTSIYDGNFWWAKGSYIKTLNFNSIRKNRANAEIKFIQTGQNWLPYTIYNSDIGSHYSEPYPESIYNIIV